MLVWAKEFSTHGGNTAADVLEVAKRWLIGSPHGAWTEKCFADSQPGEFSTHTCGDQVATTAIAKIDSGVVAGLRHYWEQKHCEWVTEVVGYERPESLQLAVRVECNALQAGQRVPKVRKPYVVRLLLEHFGDGDDAGLPIGGDPILIREADVRMAAALLSGNHDNRFPVVYVSAGARDGGVTFFL